MFFVVLGILLVVLFIVLSIVVPTYKKHREVTGGIMNYNTTMREFVYKIPYIKSVIIEKLKIKNSFDELEYILDIELCGITFNEYGTSINYEYEIKEYDDFSVLRLKQTPPIAPQSYIPYKLNSFMVQKLDAEIIPFESNF